MLLIDTCDEKKQTRVLEFMALEAREALIMLDPSEEREKTRRRMRFFCNKTAVLGGDWEKVFVEKQRREYGLFNIQPRPNIALSRIGPLLSYFQDIMLTHLFNSTSKMVFSFCRKIATTKKKKFSMWDNVSKTGSDTNLVYLKIA